MKETRPLISVVTPSFNQGSFIDDAIRSVLGQGLAAVEHIVVDAESTDETSEVLGRFPHLRVIREQDRGQSDGLNKGFLAARAPWICWLNADDYLLPGAFAAVLESLRAHPKADAMVGHYYVVDAGRNFVRSMRIPPFDPGVIRHYGVVLPTSGSFFRAGLFHESGVRLDESYRVMMDWEFYQQLADRDATIVHVPQFLSAFRRHGDNRSIGDPDDGREMRRRYDRWRAEERQKFHATYGPRIDAPLLNKVATRGLFHLHHGRFVTQKALRAYYLKNAVDRIHPPDVSPAGKG